MVRVGAYLDTPRDPLPAGLCSPPSSEDKGEVAPATSHVGPLPHALVAPEVTASTVSSAYWRIRTGLASPWWAPGLLARALCSCTGAPYIRRSFTPPMFHSPMSVYN